MKPGDRVRITKGMYTGFVGNIDHIQKNGLARVYIDEVNGKSLELEPGDGDYIQTAVDLDKLEVVDIEEES